MAPDQRNQKVWETPSLTVYGSVKEITQQTKYKEYGGGDDVLVSNQAILSNVAS